MTVGGHEPFRIVVTGATGYLGSRLVQHLASAGHHVHALVRPQSNIDRLQSTCRRTFSGLLTIHRHAGDLKSLVRLFRSVRPDTVIHLAAQVQNGPHEAEDVDRLIDANVRLTTHLAEAMTASSCVQLINTGTYWQHYNQQAYCPVNLYAATKQAASDILTHYAESAQMRIVHLELYDIYGPADPRRKLFSVLRDALSAPEPVRMSAGEQRLDLVHVDDCVRAYIGALELQNSDWRTYEQPDEMAMSTTSTGFVRTYAVRTGKLLTLKEIAYCYEQAAGVPLSVAWGERPYRDREVMVPWTGGRTLPNWKPQILPRDGIQQMALEGLRQSALRRAA